MEIEKHLFRQTPAAYGDSYQHDKLEIYKLYVEMTDRISSRRQATNSFFLSVNTAVVALASYVQFGNVETANDNLYWLISPAGMTLCFMWFGLVTSYHHLNSGKFKVIHAIEESLPIAPYDAEWEALGRGKNRRLFMPFTRIERLVPWVFCALHLVAFCTGLA